MGNLKIEAILATTDVIMAYGGMALSEGTLRQAAQDIREHGFHPTIDHDARQCINTEVQKVEIRRTDSGSLALWVQFLVDEEDWERVGDRRGLSATGFVKAFKPDVATDKPALEIFADAGHFDKAVYIAAVTSLRQHFAVGGGQMYQLSEIPPAKVVLEIAWNVIQNIGSGMLASALYDGLKHLLKPKHASESIFHLTVRRGDHVTDCYLKTNDPQALHDALATWRDVVLTNPDAETIEYENDSHKWRSARIEATDLHVSRGSEPPRAKSRQKNSIRRRELRHHK